MIKNYFNIAIRILAKQRTLAFINILSLSVGIACFSLFMFYAFNELNFDNFHKNARNIYRVYQWDEAVGDNPASGKPYHPMPLAPAMKQDLPGIENYTRFLDNWGTSFIKTGKDVLREKISFADPSFFTVFSFKLKYGNAAKALEGLRNIVLTEATAEKMFGKANPIGKIIEIKEEDAWVSFTVTAVVENPPSNSSLQFSMLGNFNYFATTPPGAKSANNWNQVSYQTFVQLAAGSNLPYNRKVLAEFKKKYYPGEEAEAREKGWKGKGSPSWYGLQPLTDIHTNTKLDGGVIPVVDTKTIGILLSIASCVLLIACINFTTLAIGRSAGRSKEVGIRKVTGGTKRSLIIQFLAEAMLLAFLSAIVGLLLAKVLLPYFNQLSGRELNFSFSQFPQFIWLIVGVVLGVGLLAGSYPAFVLSGFNPVETLKTKVKLQGSNPFTRSLVTLQFVLSSGLIIATVVIMQQLHYMQSKDPGFEKENVVVIDARGLSDTKNIYALLKQKISNHPEIVGITSAENGFGEGEGSMQTAFKYNGNDKQEYEYFVGPDYMQVLGMDLLIGRDFDPQIASDTVTSVIINEAMVNDFGWTLKNAVGQRLTGYNGDKNTNAPIVIGVVRNFNYLDMRHAVQPQMFQQFSFYRPHHFFVRIRPGNASKALTTLQAAWLDIAPDFPLKYNFLDDSLNKFYQSETRWSNIVGWAGGIAIFLASLGLLGLAALAVVNRTKEIGIRKVLGAPVFIIISLLSKDFIKLVLIAFLIAAPVALYLMNRWLQDYAYRVKIEWWVFAITGSATVFIALLTISFQAIKAAMANPVNSLKTE